MQKNNQEQGTVLRGQRRYKMGRWGMRSLDARVGQGCSISRGGPDCTVDIHMSEESEVGVTVLRQGEVSRVRAAKRSEFGEGKL